MSGFTTGTQLSKLEIRQVVSGEVKTNTLHDVTVLHVERNGDLVLGGLWHDDEPMCAHVERIAIERVVYA
jgi:hypothetical protein